MPPNKPDQRSPIIIGGVECFTYNETISTLEQIDPELSAIFLEHHPTAESFERSEYWTTPSMPALVKRAEQNGCNLAGWFLLSELEEFKLAAAMELGEDNEQEVEENARVLLDHAEELQAWRDAFSDEYIDPYSGVKSLADSLRTFITEFCTAPGKYVAPYTSVVTSSMMGKSRLMKEVATIIPTVYMCLGSNRTLYPHPTKVVVEWMRGGVEGMGYWHPSDKDFLVPTLKYCAFIVALLRGVTRQHPKGTDCSWMWKFFAEPPEDCHEINQFWTRVTEEATSVLKSHCFSTADDPPQDLSSPHRPAPLTSTRQFLTPQKHALPRDPITPPNRQTSSAPSGPQSPSSKKRHLASAEAARRYLSEQLGPDLHDAYAQLKETFNINVDGDFNMLLVFDEARDLVDTSAIDGKKIPSGVDFDQDRESPVGGNDPNLFTDYFPFSNFRALRRALHLLMQAGKHDGPIPRIFGLVTDTSSRLMNFQPALWEANSLKVNQLPPMGELQFDPIYNFTSIDVHSRTLNDPMCISEVAEVAKFDRIVKFGRPGWWAIYRHYPNKNMLEFARMKLTGMQNSDELFYGRLGRTADKTRLRLLSVLAPRLALTTGPYSREAAEIVASHLAIVVSADHHRHFLSTTYPSEPLVAAASASLTVKRNGWTNTLSALTSYIQTGIVDAGYRGELLTKILCLMAVDEAMSVERDKWPSPTYCPFAIPVKVSVFLNNLIAPPAGFETFSDALRNTTIHDQRLERFLNGYIFFNHFIRMEEKLSMPATVQAFNRCGAIQLQTNSALIDHIIPVLLAQEDGSPPNFGPLHDDWIESECAEARQHMGHIAINSKNFTNPVNWTDTYITVNQSNVADSQDPPGVMNNKLSMNILQEFGPRQAQEEHITIYPSRGKKKPLEDTTQLHVILKELSDETYNALKIPYIEPSAHEYLEKLRVATSLYHADPADSASGSISRDNIPIAFHYTSTSKRTWREFMQNRRMQVDQYL